MARRTRDQSFRSLTSRHFTAPMTAVLITLAVMLAISSPVAAEETFSPEHMAKLARVSSVAISPSGSDVAYVREAPRIPFEGDDGPAHAELRVVSSDGDDRAFVTGDVRVGNVSWTPDGGAILFTAKREGDDHTSLYRISMSGGEATRILAAKSSIGGYSLNGDGSKIAYLATDENDKAVEELKDKGFDQTIFEEDRKASRVWIASLETGSASGSDAKPQALDLEGHVTEVNWCPTGDRLAVKLAPTPMIDDVLMLSRVKIVDSRTGEVTGSVDNPGKLESIWWNPSCSHVGFIAAADVNDPRAGRLTVAPASGGSSSDLIPNYLGHVIDAGWIDDDTLVALGHEGVETAVYRIGADGSGREKIVSTDSAVWQSLDVAPNGALALVGESPMHPREAFFVPAGGGEAKRLTDSNPWLADISLAKQEAVTYSARDGQSIEGLLIHPLHREGGARVPLIVNVHGGPESHYSNGWLTSYSMPGQMAAARGYAVFLPNYRGSTGRGVAFSKLSQADAAGAEFDDLVDAVEHLVSTGLADRDRVGITGGSYGGYASAWGATKLSEHFAASVMFVGISNKISKFGTSDIPNELDLVHDRAKPYDGDWMHFLEASPIYYVDQARTPILILHGDSDTRVHPSQSMELYRALKVLGKTPVRLIFYKGEGHGNRRAASKYDYSLRMLRWFDHYLGENAERTAEPPAPEIDYPLAATDSTSEDG